MRRYLLHLMISAMFLATRSTAASQPDGCLSESSIATASATLAQQDWGQVSLAKLRTMWPSELSGLNCDPDICHSVWSMDRIIAGHCECCATFAFRIHQSGSRRVEQLDEVVLNYTAAQKDQLVAATKKIVSSTGLPDAELATVGRADEANFHWVNTTGVERKLSTITIRFTHRGQAWELFLNWGRNVIEPIPTNSQ